ncbi:MAG: carbon starvation protein A [Vibrio sp.]
MNALVLMLIGLAAMFTGYRFYSLYIAKHILKLSDDIPTPAHVMQDGVDYVPTNKFVLWGHHFTSVAGAAPIVGPAIAVIWGWLPAFIWVVVGTVFLAGVHDMAAIWASVRNKGQSMGAVAGVEIGRRAKSVLMIVVFLLLMMVNTAFGVVIAGLMISNPTAVIPVWGALLVAAIIGQCIYRYKMSLLWVSILGVVALYSLIYIGSIFPVVIPDGAFFGLPAKTTWILILYLYAFIASMLPVWVLLQPRDYINGLQLFIGLFILYASVMLLQPTMVAPVINQDLPADTPSFIPLLFVTIACGAISGFHGLVASGTTSKQINKEKDIRFVGYFGAMGEGMLALATVIAVCSGFASLDAWREIYQSYGQGGAGAFVKGGAEIVNQGVGIPQTISQTMLAVMVALFAGTTMDTGVRLLRYIFQEWGEMYQIKPMKKGVIATSFAVGVCLLLTFGQGSDGSGGLLIWPLFGTTNQLMAGLTLLIISVMLLKRGRSVYYTLIPMIFLLSMTFIALIVNLKSFYLKGDYLLLGLDVVILIATILVCLECLKALKDNWGNTSNRSHESSES